MLTLHVLRVSETIVCSLYWIAVLGVDKLVAYLLRNLLTQSMLGLTRRKDNSYKSIVLIIKVMCAYVTM